MIKVFFTSDLHFGHKKLAESRGFSSVEEMNEFLVEYWNKMVDKKDIVYHLGDFSFQKFDELCKTIQRLNGNITFILGNHDQSIRRFTEEKWGYTYKRRYDFMNISDIQYYSRLNWPIGNMQRQYITMSHYPMIVWNMSQHGSWQLHGHCHGSLQEFKGKRLDVGWDVHHKFLTFEDIQKEMESKEVGFYDYHKSTDTTYDHLTKP